MGLSVPFEQLVALALGELGAEDAAALRGQLQGDAAARETLARIQSFLATVGTDGLASPSPALVVKTLEAMGRATGRTTLARLAQTFALRVEEFRQVAASLIFDSASGAALAGFRGGAGGGLGDAAHFSYTCDLGEVDVHVSPAQHTGDHTGAGMGAGSARTMRGQFAAVTDDAPEVVYLLRLDDARQPPLTAEVDARGGFALHGVAGAGRYDLVVRCRRSLVTLREIVVP